MYTNEGYDEDIQEDLKYSPLLPPDAHSSSNRSTSLPARPKPISSQALAHSFGSSLIDTPVSIERAIQLPP